MLKNKKITKIEHDSTINEEKTHVFIERKIEQAKKTIKKVGLPKDLIVTPTA